MKNLNLTIPGDNDFFTVEAYKVLRTNLQFCGNDVRVVSITSANENEGKTTIALHLAKSFAELGKRVLVIDADMRKSVMAGRNTSASDFSGLSEILSGIDEFENCVYRTQFETLDLLFAGKYPPNPAELLERDAFGSLLASLRKFYDYIFIDTPPLGLVIDAAIVAKQVDGTALVLDERTARYRQIREVMNQLERSGGRILGAIKNKTSEHSTSYYRKGGKYGYGYGQKGRSK